MAYNVGHAKITVRPDLDGFRNSLRQQWNRQRKEFEKEQAKGDNGLKIDVNQKHLQDQIAAVNKKMDGLINRKRTVDVSARFNSREFRQQVKAALNSVNSNIVADADTKSAESKISKAAAKRTVKFDLDESAIDSYMKNRRQLGIATLTVSLKGDADAENRLNAIARTRTTDIRINKIGDERLNVASSTTAQVHLQDDLPELRRRVATQTTIRPVRVHTELVPNLGSFQSAISDATRDIKVRVRAEAAQARAETAALTRPETKNIFVNAHTDAAEKKIDALIARIGVIGRMATRGAVYSTLFTGMGIAAAGATPALVAFGSALGSTVGVIATIPAIANGAIFAMGALGLSVMRAGDTLGNVYDGLEDGVIGLKEFNEATEGASPALKEFARLLFRANEGQKTLYQGFEMLQKSSEQAFFTQVNSGLLVMDDRLRRVNKDGVKGISALNNHMTGLSTAIGAVVKNWAEFRFSFRGFKDLNTQLGNTRALMTNLVSALSEWNIAWNNLATVGSRFLPRMGESIRSSARSFAEWTNEARASGEMVRIVETALKSVKAIAEGVGITFSIMGDGLKAAGANAQGLAEDFRSGAESVKEWSSSVEGQGAMIKFFGEARAVGSELWAVLRDIGKVIATYVTPMLSEFIQGFGPRFREALGTNTDLMDAFAPAMRRLGEGLGEAAKSFSAFGRMVAPIISTVLPPLSLAFESVGRAIGALAGPTFTLMAFAAAMKSLQPVIASFTALLGRGGLPGRVLFLGTALASVTGTFEPLLKAVVALNDNLGGLPLAIAAISLASKRVGASFSQATASSSALTGGVKALTAEQLKLAAAIKAVDATAITGIRTQTTLGSATQAALAPVKAIGGAYVASSAKAKAWSASQLAASRSAQLAAVNSRNLFNTVDRMGASVFHRAMVPIGKFGGAVAGLGGASKEAGRQMVSAFRGAARGIKGAFSGILSFLGGWQTLAIAAVVGVGMTIVNQKKEAEEWAKANETATRNTGNAYKQMYKDIASGSDTMEALSSQMQQAHDDLVKIGESGPGGASRIGALWSETWRGSLLGPNGVGLVGESDAWQDFREAEEAAKAAEAAAEKIEKLNLSMDELSRIAIAGGAEWDSLMESLGDSQAGDMARDAMQKLADEAIRAHEAFNQSGPAVAEAARLFEEVAESGGEAEGSLNKVRTALMLLNGVIDPAADASAALRTQLDALAGKGDEFAGATLDASGGLDTLNNSASAALHGELSSLGSTMADAVEKGEDANAVWDAAAPALERMQRQSGLTEKEFSNLLKAYEMTPERLETAVVLTTNDTMRELALLNGRIKNLPEGEANIKLTDVSKDTKDMLEEIGFVLHNDMDGDVVLRATEGTRQSQAILDVMVNSLADITEKEWEAMVSAPGAQGVHDLIGRIVDKDIPEKISTVTDVGGQEQAELLEALGLIKIKGKKVVVNDAGGQRVLDLLRDINRNSGDVSKNVTITTTRITTHQEAYGESIGNQRSLSVAGEMARRGGNWQGGRFPGYARGDRHMGYRLPTSGPGTEDRDGFMAYDQNGQPNARLDAGEWIINGVMSERYNAELAAINAGTFPKLPGFAAGGGFDLMSALQNGAGQAASFGSGFASGVTGSAKGTNPLSGLIDGDPFAPLVGAWETVQSTINEGWNVFKTEATTAFETVKTNVTAPFTSANDTLQSTWSQTQGWMNSQWSTFSNQALATWTGVQSNVTSQFTTMQGNMTAQWTTAKNNIDNVYRTGIVPVFNALQGSLNTVQSAFGTAVQGIGNYWNRTRELSAAPVRYTIREVFNGGLVGMWNSTNDLLDTKRMSPYSVNFHTGGSNIDVLPGYTPGRDPHTFVDPVTGMSIGLSGGESIMRPEVTAEMGEARIDSLNAAARIGGRSAVRRHLGQFANGGIVDSMRHVMGARFPMLQFTSGLRFTDNGYHSKGQAADFSNGGDSTPEMQAATKWVHDNYRKQTIQLIHSPSPYNIGGGAKVGDGMGYYTPGTMAEHRNHVHWAVNSPVSLDGAGPVPAGFIAAGGDGGGFDMAAAVADAMSEDRKKFDRAVSGWNKAGLFNTLPKQAGTQLEKAFDKVIDKKAGEMSTAAGGLVSSAGVNGSNVSMGKQMAARVGWTGDKWDSLFNLWTRESNWNHLAQNPTSTAFGIPQFLDTTWATVGGTKTSDPKKQIQYGIKYVQQRYGDSNGAWRFWQANNWYDDGGYLMPGVTRANNDTGKPEPVFTAEQWQLLKKAIVNNFQNMNWEGVAENLQLAADVIVHAFNKVDWEDVGYHVGNVARESFVEGQTADALGVFGIPSPNSIPIVKAMEDLNEALREQAKEEREARAAADKEAREAEAEAEGTAGGKTEKQIEATKEAYKKANERTREMGGTPSEEDLAAERTGLKPGEYAKGDKDSIRDAQNAAKEARSKVPSAPTLTPNYGASKGKRKVNRNTSAAAMVAGTAAPLAASAGAINPALGAAVTFAAGAVKNATNSTTKSTSGATYNIYANTVDEGMRRAQMHDRQSTARSNVTR